MTEEDYIQERMKKAAVVQKNGEDFISRSYIVEKVGRLLDRFPIILDATTSIFFCNMKLQREEKDANPKLP